jgi:pimeloyl-ACP methyl ester carboxylesterase
MELRIVPGSQGNLAVESSGDGTGVPAMFLHGDGGVREHWRSAVESINGERGWIAFDRRGHGASDVPHNRDQSVEGSSRVRDRVVADALATPRETIIGALLAFRPREFERKYAGPALAIIQSQSDSPHALHRTAGFMHKTIDGAGHWLHLGAPDEFIRLLHQFLDRVDQSLEHPLALDSLARSLSTRPGIQVHR